MGADARLAGGKAKMKKAIFYTIADNNNLPYAKMMLNSLRKFHPDIPHYLYGQEELDKDQDPNKFYRSYAQVGEKLSKEYELVINLDADSIVTGDLTHIFDDDSYELGCVLNNNLVDQKVNVWNISPTHYVNAGFVAVRSQRVWKWWNRLNFSAHFEKYQYREQDMLNIMFHYGDLKCKIFDFSDKWHGLVHKGQWNKFVMRGDEMILPKTEGVCDEDKIIKIIHWAGGNVRKMNYKVYFNEDVCKRLDYLTGEEK